MSDRVSVAHVVLSLDCGGLERLVLHLIREGRQLGQDVAVVCLEKPGQLAETAEALGAAIHCVGKRPGLRPSTIRSLRMVFRRLDPTVVHTHQIAALLYAGPAAWSLGVPLVVHTEHGKHYAARRQTRWLGRLAGRYAERFFCVSEDIAAEVRRCRVVPAHKLAVVANGVDLDRFHARPRCGAVREALEIPADALVVGTVGRLCEVKRQDVLIRAFALVYKEVENCRLLIVGDGPLRAELEQEARECGVDGFVHFAGAQSEPERFFSEMDVFALTSRSEGMPLVVLEAWAAGVPVVASAVGGLPELIRDGETGMLFPPGDAATLARTLAKLLQEPTLRTRLAEQAWTEVRERFDVRRTAEAYQLCYNEMLPSPAQAQVCGF